MTTNRETLFAKPYKPYKTLRRQPASGWEVREIIAVYGQSGKQHSVQAVWLLVGNGGLDYGDYYWGLHNDY